MSLGSSPRYKPKPQFCQKMAFDWQEASSEFRIAADSSLFVIPAPWFVYTTYVRL